MNQRKTYNSILAPSGDILSADKKTAAQKNLLPDGNVPAIFNEFIRMIISLDKNAGYLTQIEKYLNSYRGLVNSRVSPAAVRAGIADVDEMGYTPLMLAAKYAQSEALVALLLKHKAQTTQAITKGPYIGTNSLMIACLHGNHVFLEALFTQQPHLIDFKPAKKGQYKDLVLETLIVTSPQDKQQRMFDCLAKYEKIYKKEEVADIIPSHPATLVAIEAKEDLIVARSPSPVMVQEPVKANPELSKVLAKIISTLQAADDKLHDPVKYIYQEMNAKSKVLLSAKTMFHGLKSKAKEQADTAFAKQAISDMTKTILLDLENIANITVTETVVSDSMLASSSKTRDINLFVHLQQLINAAVAPDKRDLDLIHQVFTLYIFILTKAVMKKWQVSHDRNFLIGKIHDFFHHFRNISPTLKICQTGLQQLNQIIVDQSILNLIDDNLGERVTAPLENTDYDLVDFIFDKLKKEDDLLLQSNFQICLFYLYSYIDERLNILLGTLPDPDLDEEKPCKRKSLDYLPDSALPALRTVFQPEPHLEGTRINPEEIKIEFDISHFPWACKALDKSIEGLIHYHKKEFKLANNLDRAKDLVAQLIANLHCLTNMLHNEKNPQYASLASLRTSVENISTILNKVNAPEPTELLNQLFDNQGTEISSPMDQIKSIAMTLAAEYSRVKLTSCGSEDNLDRTTSKKTRKRKMLDCSDISREEDILVDDKRDAATSPLQTHSMFTQFIPIDRSMDLSPVDPLFESSPKLDDGYVSDGDRLSH